jgi:diguanylate cyclase (GGDEF)-like protein
MRKGRFAGFIMAASEAADPRLRAENRLPVILAVSAPALVACIAAVASRPLYPVAAAIGAALVSWIALLGMIRRNEQAQTLLKPSDIDRGHRFLTEFERSGCGWYWETNADGILTYVSSELSTALESESSTLIGRRFEDLMLEEEKAPDGVQSCSLSFHLTSRFPFSGVGVSPTGRTDLNWSLSGRPVFDEVGRFLGFRGLALQLTEEQRQAVNSSRAAAFDSLTGLPNRARMRQLLDQALANSESRQEGCALFLIDLDRFKQVNDTLGHPVGDILLQEAARRMAEVIGAEGQVGRLGGDEFEALLPGMDEEGRLGSLAQTLIEKVSAPYLIRGNEVSIGASVGISISRPGRTLADSLIKEADLAVYAAKHAGRGTYCYFEPEMYAEENERQILEHDLRSAVAKGQLRLVFQPIVSAASEDVVGFEALLRWIHPVKGPMSPSSFLTLAESSGAMSAIGEWVIRSACAEALTWPEHLRVSINLSTSQLEQPNLPSIVAGALAASQIDPERVEFDIQESSLKPLRPEIGNCVAALKALGVKIALDDCGTGPTSLSTFSLAFLDRIKIHPNFIRQAADQPDRAGALLSSIVSLAPTLQLEVTAEGSETLDDLAMVRKLGCGEIQGYLFGRPMSDVEARELANKCTPVEAEETHQDRPARHSLIRRASMMWGGRSLSVRLRNISVQGAMIESSEPVDAGASVELDLSGGVRLEGEVRWSQDGRVGVKFAEAFDLQRLGQARSTTTHVLRPDYLKSETLPDSPWASRHDRLTVNDIRGK